MKDFKEGTAHPEHGQWHRVCELSALPEQAGRGAPLLQLPGHVPSLGHWPMTCRFAPRCADQEPHCLVESPPHVTLPAQRPETTVAHQVLCWRAGDDGLGVTREPAPSAIDSCARAIDAGAALSIKSTGESVADSVQG